MRGTPRATLRELGYVFFPRLLDPQAVLQVRAELVWITARAGWLAPGSPVLEALAGTPIDESAGEAFAAVYRQVQSVRAFHRLAHDERLVAAIELLLGEEPLCLPSKVARFKFPGQVPTAAHQDFGYIQGSVDALTAWIPLGRCRAGDGRLAVLAGSHRNGLQFAPTCGWLEVPSLSLEWHCGDMDVGDVVIFHSLTAHCAERNSSTRVRVSVDYRYQPVSDPVTDDQLLPHNFVAPWESLYSGWPKDDLMRYWERKSLRIRPRNMDPEYLRAYVAARCGVRQLAGP